MIIERLLVAFSIASLLFALTFAGTSAINASSEEAAPEVVRPLDAKALLKTLDTRLREAQTRIDEVLRNLSNAREDSERDATRVRLDVLYRLETGLTADIARTREQLARVSTR
jgi:predicted transcriptional regulator